MTNLRRLMPRGREFEQRLRHPFLMKNEIDQEEVKGSELEPKVPNRLANKQKEKEQKHSRVRHQQSPPPEHRAGRIAKSRLQRNGNLVRKIALDRLVQPFQAGRKHLLLPGEIQVKGEQKFVPGFGPPTKSSILLAQGGGRIQIRA